jgi:hypothetical protein
LAQRVANGRVLTVGLRLAEEDEAPAATVHGRVKQIAKRLLAKWG